MTARPARLASPASDRAQPPDDGPSNTFLRSSQARHWRFSSGQIREMRAQGNKAACARLQAIWAKERSLEAVAEGEPASSSSSDSIVFTTVEEEQALIRYYLTRVHQLVKAFGLSESVEATTITYIKRFYLRNTCMDHHPKNVMLTCLFLAAKAESNPVLLKHFSIKLAGKGASEAAIQEYATSVQKLEFLVSQSLDFQFMVHGAHRALHGLLLDAQQTVQPAPSSDTLHSLVEPARNNLKQSRFTDAELIYTPAQIALACVRSASPAGKDLVERYLEAKSTRAKEVRLRNKSERDRWRKERGAKAAAAEKEENGDAPQNLELSNEGIEQAPLGVSETNLKSVLSEIEQQIQEKLRTANDDVEQVKTIDKKLKLCQNPENIETSRISKDKERKKQEVLLGKRKNIKTSQKEEDPFADDDEEGDGIAATQGQSKKVKVES